MIVLGKFIDLTGQKFHRATVLHCNGRDKFGNATWCCQCDCGNIFTTNSQNLKSGVTKSCGCFRKDYVSSAHKERFEKSNIFQLNSEYGIGITNNTKREFLFDLEDYEKIKDLCWYETSVGYIRAVDKRQNIKQKPSIFLHSLILNTNRPIDHINGVITDNRKSNLRIAEGKINHYNHRLAKSNTSGVTGVTYHKKKDRWVARISYQNKRYYLGSFKTFDEAVKTRLNAEKLYFGKYARDLNYR